MPKLVQFDYLFAIGTMFAFLDAWNIGANDVANSFATSVSSRSLTYIQAMGIATVMEFSGSLGVGARVAETIRTKIINPSLFAGNPQLLMLGMVCAVCGSSIFLTLATRAGMPVSTTHSIVGGVIGMGVASVGAKKITWWGGSISSGVVQVFLAWIFAPIIAGCFASIIFLVTKYAVLLRKNPVMKGFVAIPIYFGITSALLTMLIVWKGGASRITLTSNETIGVIIGVGACVALLVAIFFLPWLYRRLIKDDWELRWYHIFMGPLLLKRGEVTPSAEDSDHIVQNYYRGHLTMDELHAKQALDSDEHVKNQEHVADPSPNTTSTDLESHTDVPEHAEKSALSIDASKSKPILPVRLDHKPIVGPKPEGKFFTSPVLFWWFKNIVFHGVDQDIVGQQNLDRNFLAGDLVAMHARAEHYNNKVEYMYSFLQVMTAATASFTHGANDVSNAVGPYATIYYIWSTGQLKSSAPVPYWILCFGGAAIVLGLWTYGYNIMRNLGNRITLHSPSRGFSMELGSAITVIMATRLKLPVSTTQCISGATVGVGLCNGTWRTINWRMVAWIYMSWLITLPCAGIISGCLMGIIINAPRWGYKG